MRALVPTHLPDIAHRSGTSSHRGCRQSGPVGNMDSRKRTQARSQPQRRTLSGQPQWSRLFYASIFPVISVARWRNRGKSEPLLITWSGPAVAVRRGRQTIPPRGRPVKRWDRRPTQRVRHALPTNQIRAGVAKISVERINSSSCRHAVAPGHVLVKRCELYVDGRAMQCCRQLTDKDRRPSITWAPGAPVT
jgi:hypothetical protein